LRLVDHRLGVGDDRLLVFHVLREPGSRLVERARRLHHELLAQDRATMSVAPPGPYGTAMRMGFVG
jgi:hypothetical protein